MGLAAIGIDAMAGAGTLTDEDAITGGDADAYPGDVGDTPAALALTADGALVFAHAAADQGVALPAVETKDSVGLCDHLPTLEVGDAAAALLALAHMGAIQGSGEQRHLPFAETPTGGGARGPLAMGGYRCRRGMSTASLLAEGVAQQLER